MQSTKSIENQLSSETLMAHLDAIISDALVVKKHFGSRPVRQMITKHIR